MDGIKFQNNCIEAIESINQAFWFKYTTALLKTKNKLAEKAEDLI